MSTAASRCTSALDEARRSALGVDQSDDEEGAVFVRRAFLCATLAFVAGAANAQNWPSRPIKLIVPNGPGLASDILARLYADRMSQALGQQMYVENVPAPRA